jgi:hypothetical protein
MPVILVVDDAVADKAYWLYVQAYFERKKTTGQKAKVTETVYIPRRSVLRTTAVRYFVEYKSAILAQGKGVSRHA